MCFLLWQVACLELCFLISKFREIFFKNCFLVWSCLVCLVNPLDFWPHFTLVLAYTPDSLRPSKCSRLWLSLQPVFFGGWARCLVYNQRSSGFIVVYKSSVSLKKKLSRGTWMAQSLNHPTLGFSLRSWSWRHEMDPASHSTLSRESAQPSLSPLRSSCCFLF